MPLCAILCYEEDTKKLQQRIKGRDRRGETILLQGICDDTSELMSEREISI